MAKYGLRIRDKNGNITFDSTMRFPQYRGVVYTGLTNGSYVVPDANAKVWINPVFNHMVGTNLPKIAPIITIKNNVISWVFNTAEDRGEAIIYHGIY